MEMPRPDPQAIANRQRERAKRAAETKRDFQERTQRQFAEFKDVFDTLMERAQLSATKRAARDKEQDRYRSSEDLVNSSFRSRLLTVLWHRRGDWHLGDVAKWLEMLGVAGIEVSEILRQYGKRYQLKVIDAAEARKENDRKEGEMNPSLRTPKTND